MGASLLNQWFYNQNVKAICWTLIHSLWVGIIIALLTALVIMLTRKSRADLRYRLLCCILVLFFFSVSVIFCLEMRSTGSVRTNPDNVKLFMGPVNIDVTDHGFKTPHISPVKVAINFLDANTNIIFIIWLLFFIMRSLKMASGLLYIQRIRNYKIHAIGEEFKQKIALFSRRIGIRQTVNLLQSELVKVPVAVGWLKPAILLPMGIILQLTPEQLDSILWHELAHIRRRDYLVNILQGLVETVFFFNPGLLWLSSLIRAEREACCDDLVLSQMNHKVNYLEALLSFGFGEYKQSSLAMGIGSGNQLRDRLKRMVNQENKRLSIAEKVVLCVGLVLVSAFTTISKDNPVIKNFRVKFTTPSGKVEQKTIPVSVHSSLKAQLINDRIRQGEKKDSVMIKDTAIRLASVLFKNGDSDMANNDITAIDTHGKRYHLVVADDRLVAMEISDTKAGKNGSPAYSYTAKIPENELPSYQYLVTYINRTVAEKRRVRAEDIAAYKVGRPMPKFSGAPGSVSRSLDSLQALYRERWADNERTAQLRDKIAGLRKRAEEDSLNYAVQFQRTQNLIADLVNEKVVSSAANVKWFGLSSTEFIVNGQKQSAETQQRYKAKYGIHENWGLYYGPVEMTGTGVFMEDKATYQVNSMRRSLDTRKEINSDEFSLRKLKDEPLDVKIEREKEKELLLRRMSIDQQNVQREKELLLTKFDDAQPKKFMRDIQFGDKLMQSVITDLVNEHVVDLAPDVKWFRLTEKVLIVNGKMQPAELQQVLKAKYGIERGNGLFYGPDEMKDRGVFVKDSARREFAKGDLTWYSSSNTTKFDHNFDSKVKLPDLIASIEDDLMSENILKYKDDLRWFSLTNSSLIVNGKTLAEELHKKLKSKYLEPNRYPFNKQVMDNPNFGFHYNSKADQMSIGIANNQVEDE
jgi:bla regulator protein blaR1